VEKPDFGKMFKNDQMTQQVYVLRCHQYHGQTEGIFLTLEEIEKYLRKHPRQPTPPDGCFEETIVVATKDKNGKSLHWKICSDGKKKRLTRDQISREHEYWDFFRPEEGHFTNHFFEVKRVPYLGTLATPKTWLGNDSGYYALYYKGHSWGDGACIAASDDELLLKKIGLEKLLKEVYPKEKKAKEILKILEKMEEDEVEKLWEERVVEDTWTTPCYIMEVGE